MATRDEPRPITESTDSTPTPSVSQSDMADTKASEHNDDNSIQQSTSGKDMDASNNGETDANPARMTDNNATRRKTGRDKSKEKSEVLSLTCDICQLTFPRRYNLVRHQERHATGHDVPCPRGCPLRFVSKVALGQHVTEVHHKVKREKESGPPYSCHNCGKEFTRAYDRNQHEKLHHGELSHANICRECGKTFATKWGLNAHKLTHLSSDQRPTVLCDICGRHFFTKSALTDHRKRHLGDAYKRYICDVCGAQFYRASHLEQHLDTHRLREPNEKFKCEICGKLHSSSLRLDVHRRTVHVSPDRLLHCAHCQKTFKTNKCLRRHVKIHEGVKEHVCKYCNKAFTQKGNLSAHVRIHTGERPYTCTFCGMRFVQSQQMKTHVKNSHIDVTSNDGHVVDDVTRRGMDDDVTRRGSVDDATRRFDVDRPLLDQRIDVVNATLQYAGHYGWFQVKSSSSPSSPSQTVS